VTLPGEFGYASPYGNRWSPHPQIGERAQVCSHRPTDHPTISRSLRQQAVTSVQAGGTMIST
jgi:hypothetical protein